MPTDDSTPGGLLFKLPAELRNIIYKLVVIRQYKQVLVDEGSKETLVTKHNSTDGSDDSSAANTTSTRGEVVAVQPALTRTCSVIRKETLPIFYGTHDFVLNIWL